MSMQPKYAECIIYFDVKLKVLICLTPKEKCPKELNKADLTQYCFKGSS